MLTIINLTIVVTIHLMMAAVMSLYSRHKIHYLSLAWIFAIFSGVAALAIPHYDMLNFETVGLLHPFMVLSLMATVFLQGVYPISIPMPGYLQLERMVRYALPAILLIVLYILNLLFGNRPMIIHSYAELVDNFFQLEMFYRIAGLLLSIHYTVNIVWLPYRLARKTPIPKYLIVYAILVGINSILYIISTAIFNVTILYVYINIFTALNMYLFFRTLETMALNLPKPVTVEVEHAPSEESAEPNIANEDYNIANRMRFERVEYFMQHKREWQDNTFGRDRLCEATGINRHLMLQCLRSQGYNDCHEYINSYRIKALKRNIREGKIEQVADAVMVGFGSAKTARNCFERMEGRTLDSYLAEKLGKSDEK